MSELCYDQESLAGAPVVSAHDEPQVSPQEWDCGCIAAVYVTDRDSRLGERPFELRLVHDCRSERCQRHAVLDGDLA